MRTDGPVSTHTEAKTRVGTHVFYIGVVLTTLETGNTSTDAGGITPFALLNIALHSDSMTN